MRRAFQADWTRWLAAIPLALGAAPTAFAQGCVMCYTSAAGQNDRALHSFDMAILALLIPVLLLFLGVLGFAYRRFKLTEDGTAAPEQRPLWQTFSPASRAARPHLPAGWTAEMR
jgi:hypothetical protein